MSATQLLRILTDLPLWEQDALKKMLSHGSFDEQDRLRALALIQQAAGIRHEGPVLVAEPVSADDLIHFAPAAGALFLAGVEAVIDCNALAPGARLPIEPTTGLNIYVGRNGSGKSSFTRLFRVAGSSRVRGSILPDVFTSRSGKSEAHATFDILADGTRQKVNWRESDRPHQHLSKIAVYDRECSSMYLEQGNVADFLPRGMDVLAGLIELRKWLKLKLEGAAAEIYRHTPEYDSALFGTEVHNVLVGWGTPADKAANLKRLAAWTAADDERFADLSKQLEALTLNRQTLKDEVEKLATAQTSFIALQSADSAVLELAYRIPDTLLTDLKQVSQSIEEKRLRLATVEAQAIRNNQSNRSDDFLLEGWASPEWFALLRAARSYSEAHAYPNSPFPAVEPEHRCPLCQQQFDGAAISRLQRFAEALSAVENTMVTEDGQASALHREIDELELLLASHVRKFDDALALVHQAVRDAQRGSQDPALAAAMEQLESALEALALQAKQGRFLEMTISNLAYADVLAGDELARVRDIVSDTIQGIERSMVAGSDGLAENELKEMRARKWLKPRLNQLVQQVELEHKALALQAIASELSTTPITNLSKRIAAELVTNDLVLALRGQLTKVGLGYLRAQVVTSGRAGVTTIRLAPPAKSFKKTDMSEVLSEGEQALMGLAAFFAELDVAGHTGPIVLDDPISGLDRENRQVMAERLAEAGRDRQVLVLTHDDEFASMLETEAQNRTVKSKRWQMLRTGARVGIVQ